MGSALALCDMAEDPNEDGRVRAVAAQQVLTWAFGKPPDYDPREDRPAVEINTAVLSAAERNLLLSLLRRGLLKEPAPDPSSEPPAEIEGKAEGG